jgi:hypothetical protein
MRRYTASLAVGILAGACGGDSAAPERPPTPSATRSPEPAPQRSVESPEPSPVRTKASPKPTRTEKPFDVQKALRGYLCGGGPEPLYRLPGPVYSGTFNSAVSGFGELARVRGTECREARILARAPLFPSEADGAIASRPQILRWSYLGSSGGLWVRIEVSDSLKGWIELNTDPILFLPGQSLHGVLETLPVEIPRPLRPHGLPDLAFVDAEPLAKPGDPCVPGNLIPYTYRLAIRNAGTGTAPTALRLAVTGAGPLRGETVDDEDWLRGLEPGEEFAVAGFFPGTRFVLDPEGRIRESDEGNNSLTLDPLPPLVCQ